MIIAWFLQENQSRLKKMKNFDRFSKSQINILGDLAYKIPTADKGENYRSYRSQSLQERKNEKK